MILKYWLEYYPNHWLALTTLFARGVSVSYFHTLVPTSSQAQPMIHEILPKIPGSTQKLATVFNVVTIIWFLGTYTNSHHRCITELWSVLSILYVTKQTFKFCVPFVQYSIMAKSWRSNWPSHMASPLNSSHVQLSLLLWLGYGVVLYAALKVVGIAHILTRASF